MMEKDPVIIDNGTESCKFGFEPLIWGCGNMSVIPTVVGKNKKSNVVDQIGDNALAMRESLNLKYPIKNGLIQDWDDMEKIWLYGYQKKGLSPEQQYTCLIEATLNPKSQREKMAQIFFEKFHVPGCLIVPSGYLSLIACGRNTGIAMDSGEGVTQITPVYEGYSFPQANIKTNLAGSSCNDLLQMGLDLCTTSTITQETIKDIKEKLCYVALDYKAELDKYKESDNKEYKLPDNNTVTLQNQRFVCPEVFFNPGFVQSQSPSFPQLIYNSIMACDIDVRREFYQNIILSGGNTLFPGMPERLSKEITALSPPTMKIKVIAPIERKYCNFVGGSIICSLSTTQLILISQAEYSEFGSSIIHRRFL